MKNPFRLYPNLSRLILGALLTALALIGSGMIPIPIPHFREYFPFIGTILLTLVAWLMYRTEGKNLSVLGLDLTSRNIVLLPIGLILGVAAYIFGFQLTCFITGAQWHLNSDSTGPIVLRQLYWVLPAAAVQELTVRGYCFKKLAEMTSPKSAIIIAGFVFIAMHDFWNGDIINILFYSATLFLGHLWFSEALLKSGSIYFPIGLHWGNNFANGTLFTMGKTDTSVFFTTYPNAGTQDFFRFILLFVAANLGFGLMTFAFWRWLRPPAPYTPCIESAQPPPPPLI